jgi:hypothetical protein
MTSSKRVNDSPLSDMRNSVSVLNSEIMLLRSSAVPWSAKVEGGFKALKVHTFDMSAINEYKRLDANIASIYLCTGHVTVNSKE